MTATPAASDVRLPTRGMLVVGAMVLAVSVVAFFRVPLLPSVADELAMSPGQLGLITTVFGAGRLATDLPAGRLADRVPPVALLGAAGVALAVGSVAFGLAATPRWVIASGFVLGIASATANTSGMTYFSTAAPTHQRGMAMAGFSAALLGGQALGPTAGGLLGDTLGWRTTMVTAGVVGGVVALAGLRSHRRREGPVPQHGTAPGAAVGRDGAEPPPALQRGILYAIPFASFFALSSMPQTLVPVIAADRYGLTASLIGLGLGLGGVCRLVGSFVGGHLADTVSRKASLVPGLVLFGLGVGSFAFDLGVSGWVAGIVLLSLGSYGISVSATMLADLAGGAGVGRRLGTYRFVGDTGLIIGPVATATLYERVGAAAATGVVAALLLGVALLSATLLQETHRSGATTG